MVFDREPLRPALEEALSMLTEHQARVAHFPTQRLDPDPHVWDEVEAAGLLRVFTVRDGGTLVGVGLLHVGPHPTWGHRTAQQLALCVDPRVRRGWVGVAFLKYIERALRDEGCQYLYQETMPMTSPALPRVLTRLGYRPVGTLYAKELL